jgi:hypothetical protein
LSGRDPPRGAVPLLRRTGDSSTAPYAGHENHPLIDVFLKAIEIGASKQSNVTLSPIKTTPIIVSGTDLANMASHRASTVLSAAALGLMLSGEPATTGSGVAEREEWDWDLTSYPPLRKFTLNKPLQNCSKLDSSGRLQRSTLSFYRSGPSFVRRNEPTAELS